MGGETSPPLVVLAGGESHDTTVECLRKQRHGEHAHRELSA